MTTITPAEQQRIARATLTYLAEPADPAVCGLLQVLSPAELVASIRSGSIPATVNDVPGGLRAASATLRHCRSHLHRVPADAGLASSQQQGARLICPGDPDWPIQLEDLGTGRPYALWVRGTAALRSCCQRAVAIVGSRAVTAYGAHVATEIAAGLSGQGWTIVSGAAYGIDAAVLACGVDHAYPRAHADLLASIAAHGAVISEYPPGQLPQRRRFLFRT